MSFGCSLLDPAATFQKSGIERVSLLLDPLTLNECRGGKWELACRMQKGTVLSPPVLLITEVAPLFSYKKVSKGEKVKPKLLSFSTQMSYKTCSLKVVHLRLGTLTGRFSFLRNTRLVLL